MYDRMVQVSTCPPAFSSQLAFGCDVNAMLAVIPCWSFFVTLFEGAFSFAK